MDDKKPDKQSKRPRPAKVVSEMLTPEEIEDLRRQARENAVYFEKVFSERKQKG